MDIYPLGHSSFRIKGKQVTVVTDPYDSSMLGFKYPKVESPDIITISHDHADHNKKDNFDLSTVFVTSGPGEFEVKGVTILGIPTFHDDKKGEERGKNIVFTMTIDDLAVCHLGDLGHKLDDEQVTRIGQVEILFVPVGGFYTLNAEQAYETVTQLEPKIVIPMHYKTPKYNQETFGQVDTVDTFLKMMGVEDKSAQQPKLSITRDKLPENTTVIVLE